MVKPLGDAGTGRRPATGARAAGRQAGPTADTPERSDRKEQTQRTRYGAQGSSELSIPYSNDREIPADILRSGPDVQVLAPHALQLKVQQRLVAAASRYITEN